jgi:TM2 domain-containing membrane protein YozV
VINQKSKSTAALLAFFLGGAGIHRFYLGYTGIGFTQLFLLLGGWLTCGITAIGAGIWAFVDFIRILTGSLGKDAEGRPLI